MLTKYLEEFGNYSPKKHEIESILRRCDHDADHTLNKDEFCELFDN